MKVSTISADANRLCYRLKLLLLEKKKGYISKSKDEKNVAKTNKHFEYSCIVLKQQKTFWVYLSISPDNFMSEYYFNQIKRIKCNDNFQNVVVKDFNHQK